MNNIFHFVYLSQKLRYQSLTKTRRYIYRGQLHTRRTSRVIVSGAEAVELRERETRSVLTLRVQHVMCNNFQVVLSFTLDLAKDKLVNSLITCS